MNAECVSQLAAALVVSACALSIAFGLAVPLLMGVFRGRP